MKLKILLGGAAALSALVAANAWAGDPQAQVEERREVVISDDPHGHHCHVMTMHMGSDDAMKAMHDHHGEITRDEFIAMHAKMFDDLDLNHDGKLEPDEIDKAHSSMMSGHDEECAKVMHDHMGMHGDMDMHGDGLGPIHDDHGEGDRHVEIRMVQGAHDFDKMDANHDGRISFEEFAAPLREAFDDLDKNHDRSIDKAEWETAGHMEIRKEVHEDH
ncbi:MAG TPA: EF-hand domain-containing protein [Caulobacteraceae bacterium]|jgi:Ca2+-binding EF-hand superfamily protein|nr:EF-hand domain-containing protein [Caulobacteraceae bacterium]